MGVTNPAYTETTTAHAERAAWLCKADLTTQMVIEFPTLQGITGRYYAQNSGEPEPVATAIAEHYQPLGADTPLPETEVGALLAIADKLDTIVGYFGIEERPTGSQDPYSLRRHGSRYNPYPPRSAAAARFRYCDRKGTFALYGTVSRRYTNQCSQFHQRTPTRHLAKPSNTHLTLLMQSWQSAMSTSLMFSNAPVYLPNFA